MNNEEHKSFIECFNRYSNHFKKKAKGHYINCLVVSEYTINAVYG